MLIPSQPLRNVPPKEFSGGMSVDTANAAMKTVEAVIAEEANSGWILHSVNEIHKLIIRKKTILEFIFGWIPILGKFMCPNIGETRNGVPCLMYMLTFVKEV